MITDKSNTYSTHVQSPVFNTQFWSHLRTHTILCNSFYLSLSPTLFYLKFHITPTYVAFMRASKVQSPHNDSFLMYVRIARMDWRRIGEFSRFNNHSAQNERKVAFANAFRFPTRKYCKWKMLVTNRNGRIRLNPIAIGKIIIIIFIETT